MVGPNAQHLFDAAPSKDKEDDKEAALIYHITRWRTTLVRGIWSEDLDR